MKTKVLTVVILVLLLACNQVKENAPTDLNAKPESEMVFDKTKWQIKEGKDYPFREKMLNDVVYNDTIRELNKTEILKLLGEPSWYRDNKNYLYYMITQKRLFSWPLHTTTMVVKLKNDETIEWIKIHK